MPPMFIDRSQSPAVPVTPAPPRDLADFHLRWDDFRPIALEAMNASGLCAEHTEIMGWLIVLADRIGMADQPF